MAQKKVRIPKVSMRQVERLLDACVRPIADDPITLEIVPEMVPPLFRLTILPKQGRRATTASADSLLVQRDQWDVLFSYLYQTMMGLVMEVEEFALADKGPSASDLAQAPLADP